MDGFERRTKRTKRAIVLVTGAADLAAKLGSADFMLNPEGGRLVVSMLADAALEAKRSLQDCYWAQGEIEGRLRSRDEQIVELTEERDELQRTNVQVEAHFQRFSAFVNWVAQRGHADTNPTEVMSGNHESCPPNAKPETDPGF